MEKSILVVEDDISTRSLIVDYLADAGFLVYEAADGAEALEIVERERPKVMILDLHLVRMHGLEVLRNVMILAPDTVVVVLSGSQEEAHAKEAIQQGAYDYLTKPLNIKKLQTQVLDRIFN